MAGDEIWKMSCYQYMGLPTERKCQMCGKRFCAREEYVFTRGTDSHKLWFCSWGCLRKFDLDGETPDKMSEHGKKIIRLLNAGKRARDIAEEMGIKIGMVYYYDRKRGLI